jgi:hypothetical protein
MPVTHWLAGWRLGSFLTADKEGSDVQQGLFWNCFFFFFKPPCSGGVFLSVFAYPDVSLCIKSNPIILWIKEPWVY